MYIEAKTLYGFAMSESLPHNEIKFPKNVNLEDILNIPDDSDIGFFVEVDLKYPDKVKEKTKIFTFCPENITNPQDKYCKHLKDTKPLNYTQNEKLIFDWTDKKNYLIHYRMLKSYIRHGLIVDKFHEIMSFRKNQSLEIYINIGLEMNSKKDLHKLLKNSFQKRQGRTLKRERKCNFSKKMMIENY